MGAPQITLLILFFISILITANKHGQPKENHNIWYSLISLIINILILYWGGFFK